MNKITISDQDLLTMLESRDPSIKSLASEIIESQGGMWHEMGVGGTITHIGRMPSEQHASTDHAAESLAREAERVQAAAEHQSRVHSAFAFFHGQRFADQIIG